MCFSKSNVKVFLKLALMNKRGEHKIPFLHEVIRKQDVQTCYRNLKRNTCIDAPSGWVYYRGFHAGRDLKWKKFSLSVSIVFGLHEKLICSMSWIQAGYTSYTITTRSMSWTSSFDCKVFLPRSSSVSSEYRSHEWRMLLSFLQLRVNIMLAKGGKDWVLFGKCLWVP